MQQLRHFTRRVVGAMAIGFGAVALAGASAVWAVRENQAFSEAVTHTYQVERAIAEFRVSLERLEASRRGYMLEPGEPRFPQTYAQASESLPSQLRAIRALVADDPSQVARVDEIGRASCRERV